MGAHAEEVPRPGHSGSGRLKFWILWDPGGRVAFDQRVGRVKSSVTFDGECKYSDVAVPRILERFSDLASPRSNPARRPRPPPPPTPPPTIFRAASLSRPARASPSATPWVSSSSSWPVRSDADILEATRMPPLAAGAHWRSGLGFQARVHPLQALQGEEGCHRVSRTVWLDLLQQDS